MILIDSNTLIMYPAGAGHPTKGPSVALLERILARDALHAAVVMTQGFEAICGYDRDFDGIPGIVRREPGEL